MPSETLRNRRPLSINTMSAAATTAEAAEEPEELEEPVSPAGRLFHRPEFNCYIIAVIGLGRRIDDLDTIKAGLAATLARHPRFSSVPVFDESAGKKPRWVRVDVDVDRHVIVPNLPPLPSAAAAAAGELVVEDYVSALSAAAAMDATRPLWELHILNLPTPSAAASAVLRAHHSLGDGASLTSLLLACTRRAGDPSALPSLPSAAPRPRPHHGRGRGPLGLLLWLWSLLAMAWHTLVDAALFAATAAFLADSPTPLKAPPLPPGDPLGVGRRRKRFVHRTASLDDVKRVKNAMGCTVNDVLVGVTSAGLSRYLSRKFDETDDVKKREKLLANLRVRSTLLVNVRPTAGIHDLAEMMKGGKDGPKWGNWIGYVVLPIPIALYSDPLDYIRKGKEIANRKKNSWEAFFTYWCADLIVKLFGLKAAATLCHRVLSNTTLSFSNIVGPVEEIEFYGYPIVYIAPSVYGHPHALTVHYQSYVNTVEMVIAVDEITIPDPHQLLDDLAESLELIKDSTETKS
ncbi:O-acyltransferase WSD1-like [Ananas comosus]|uniref:O-acyltransferase WSD1-like n=1 Tax=Ananas comosus TaxID=4615 RepID=A0A6P5G548_ANACO|nr:O-acyltransferase WSD1-like [Ananas comosus]